MIENRFTQSGQRVISGAKEMAMRLGNDYMGSEHLLLGMINLKEGNFLLPKNITVVGVIEILKGLKLVGEETKIPPRFLTKRCKKIIEMSFFEAEVSGVKSVEYEHILMSLLKESDCAGASILVTLGVDLQRTKNDVKAFLKDSTRNEGEQLGAIKKSGTATPILNKYGKDLTVYGQMGKIDQVIGREKEIDRVIQILGRKTKNNPCLIGEPGVGKTAIAEGLALKIAQKDVPEFLIDQHIVTLELSSMVAGAKYRGEFEERLKGAMEEVRKSENIILFIDEIHTIVGAGAAEGAIDAANILKPTLARGELRVIGATTNAEYRKFIEKDGALERRFAKVNINEPSAGESIEIIKGIKEKFESHHKIKISDSAIESAVTLSVRYLTERFLPDKAIDLMDEGCARLRLDYFTPPKNYKNILKKLDVVIKRKDCEIANENFPAAAKLKIEERALIAQMEKIKDKWCKKGEEDKGVLLPHHIEEIVSKMVGIPQSSITKEEGEKLSCLADNIKKQVIGQDVAVEAVTRAIKRSRVGLADERRPIGSFIFLGPTGVGKTQLCKSLSKELFGSESALITVDMSEYMEKHAVSKIIGSPPGYIGFDDGNHLTEKIRKKPYSVILFDEIEKAHPEIFNILLSVLEEGQITDSTGRVVNMKNTIIILTSNIGSHAIVSKTSLGFIENENGEKRYEKVKAEVSKELKKTFKPEFLNRLDDIIIFNKLSEEKIYVIASNMIEEVEARLEKIGIKTKIKESAIAHICKAGFDENYGARPIKRKILTEIEDKLTDKILSGEVKKGTSIEVFYEDDEMKIKELSGAIV